MSDILLLNLPVTPLGYGKMAEFASRSFPIGLGSLSGVLAERGLSLKVLDADAMNLTVPQTILGVEKENPKIIGISTYTTYAGITGYIVAEIKKILKDAVIVLGGHHAFAVRDALLKETMADIIVIGEGEAVFYELCSAILSGKDVGGIKGIYYRDKDGIKYTGDREYAKDLDAIPLPAYELFPMDRYVGHVYRRWTSGFRKPFANIITSRGCPFSCGFCSNVMWGKKVRFRSPERVMEEIDLLVKDYGIKQLSIFDDTFTLDMKRAERICDLLIERGYGLDIYCSTRVDSLNEGLAKKMAKAGFKWVGIGIESGNERMLKKISKGQSVNKCAAALRMLADNGIAVYGSVILGYPEEDKGTLKDTLSFILKNPIHFPQINVFVPYPGTPIYDELVAKGVDVPRDVNQFSGIISYNKSISNAYLKFFYWYSYTRSILNLKYLNLIRKTFKMRLVIWDFFKMSWALFVLDRNKKTAEEIS